MVTDIFYQSSLPRAGSTVFQNILHENPSIYATPTDGVLELLFGARGNFTNSLEFKAQDSKQMQQAFKQFCSQGMKGFYESITDRPYVMSKSRGWGIHYGFLNEFHPNPKIICLVRDIRDIISSMEKKFRQNQLQSDNILNWSEFKGTTTYKRTYDWLNGIPVGLAIERLSEIFHQGINEKMLFIRFEDLCSNPEHEMRRVYNYLELPFFSHNFNNIQQFTQEDDSVYGIYGDHKIKSKLTPLKSNSVEILGLHLHAELYDKYQWFFKQFNYSK